MWQSIINSLETDLGQQVTLWQDDDPLSYQTVIHLWQQEPTFRQFFGETLAAAPFTAYFWETPPVTQATLSQIFEFVLIPSSALAQIRADPRAFQEHFDSAEVGVVTFANLGGDALLVAPTPLGDLAAYAHLATFMRQALPQQQQALWQRVGTVLAERVSDRPLWLSTSGLGVPWLHLRLDTRPKYYSYGPYRTFAG